MTSGLTPAAALLGILGTLAIGAMDPGPSFVFVVRTAVARSRGAGIAAAVGMGIGGVVGAKLAVEAVRRG